MMITPWMCGIWLKVLFLLYLSGIIASAQPNTFQSQIEQIRTSGGVFMYPVMYSSKRFLSLETESVLCQPLLELLESNSADKHDAALDSLWCAFWNSPENACKFDAVVEKINRNSANYASAARVKYLLALHELLKSEP